MFRLRSQEQLEKDRKEVSKWILVLGLFIVVGVESELS